MAEKNIKKMQLTPRKTTVNVYRNSIKDKDELYNSDYYPESGFYMINIIGTKREILMLKISGEAIYICDNKEAIEGLFSVNLRPENILIENEPAIPESFALKIIELILNKKT